ncbi:MULTISPECIES: DUF7551 domain-containing protein [Halomicrobium]|uniref:Uncharacterized protein n=2 Tax=Halomicrobium mukohataei TaxID=57705 RepID=C7NVZ3_HALMD|nr:MULTISPECIES: hypothetical protein [Halomicrobium]ACV48122.1 conserved hypothetical protein [Halomicrobium mukohataei DSM 12286]QCD66549.1 hypothetical protein E5139_13175 [Halomicrobium mukohataei]QFR21355.1 hypothetical protein GBQ70_13190 [Halomicrobium sp. ZPS1]
MIGTTLAELRERVERLATDDGSYRVVCGRTGERPVPVATLRFDSRSTARLAVRATEQYRSTLRTYDPRTPRYDLIVCEESDPFGDRALSAGSRPDTDAAVPSVADACDSNEGTQRRIEFCHRVAAAVFEALSDGPYDDLETAIVDAYFELAETVDDPDDLCLCLLECLATEFDARLRPDQQAALLTDAASQLTPVDRTRQPVATALAALQRRGLVGEFSCRSTSIDRENRRRTVQATLSAYALSVRDGRLPVLPVAVELSRHQPEWSLSGFRVVDADRGWRLVVELGGSEPMSLSTVPVQSP